MRCWVFEWTAVCYWCLQAGSDTAVCDDLRELRDETEGVRLWSKRSKTSFRLEVLSWDSEPESWDCGDMRYTVTIVKISVRKLVLCYFKKEPLTKNTKNKTCQTKVSPCLLWSQVAILQFQVLYAVLLLPQHNYRAKTVKKIHICMFIIFWLMWKMWNRCIFFTFVSMNINIRG